MLKKISLVLVLAVIAVGGAFAQMDFEAMPKNTITVDFGPTIIGAAIKTIGDILVDDVEDVSASGFGIALQYERDLLQNVSAGGRFAYLSGGIGFATGDDGTRVTAELNISSFSLEGHARYYPFSGALFLDGMLGYANMTMSLSGQLAVTDDDGKEKIDNASYSISRSYLKYGVKLGWRIDFGKPGGFIFEPSFGYYGGIGLGDTFGKRLSKEVDGEVEGIDEVFGALEDWIFIGGPRLTLSFGWRF